MTQAHPMLLHIIVAIAALYMSNASHNPASNDVTTSSHGTDQGAMRSSQSRWSVVRGRKPYEDALAAKQRAIRSLRHTLMDKSHVHTDATLATVLLFTEFELWDSGRDTWAHHIKGAQDIIEALWRPELSQDLPMSPLRSCLISTSLVFDVIGSTLTASNGSTKENSLTSATLSLLQDAEGNHCSSFPGVLLDVVRSGLQSLQLDRKASQRHPVACYEEQALGLLKKASTFDPLTWAAKVQFRSPEDDHANREHIAFAHRAAACIYLSRVVLCINPEFDLTHDLEAFVTDIVYHLSFVRPGDALLTASTWPAFVAGAETNLMERQAWVTTRLRELWDAEPWGLFRGALEVLEGIWETRSNASPVSELSSPTTADSGENWLNNLRTMGVDWLII